MAQYEKMYNEGIYELFVFNKGNGTASVIHLTDHGRPDSHTIPHAHDSDSSSKKPHGQYRSYSEMTSNEKYAYESFKNE